MKRYFKYISVAILLCAALIATACSQEKPPAQTADPGNNTVPVDTKPITLVMFVDVPGLSDNDFKQLLAAPVQNKYPHITLQMIRPEKGKQFADLVTAGTLPDLMYGTFGGNLTVFNKEYHATINLDPLVKKYNVDLGKFNPQIIEQIRIYSDRELHSLPFTQNTFGMFYNKNIFDRFGVAYPPDGMVWEDALALAKKLTQTEDKTAYRGLEVYNNANIYSVAAPLSPQLYDEKTGKAVISDLWKKVFAMTMDVYSIPGNRPGKIPPGMVDEFLNKQTLAMAPTFTNGIFAGVEKMGEAFNWDIAQPPSYKEAPNTTYPLDVHQISISSATKFPDQAFQVIQLVTSESVQIEATKKGKLTVLNDPKIRELFATELPYTAGKHIPSLLKSTPAMNSPYSLYNNIVTSAINAEFRDVFDGKADINTALMQAEEKANRDIEQKKMSEQ